MNAPSRRSADTEGTGRITPDAPASPAPPQGEREAFDGLSAKLWCDLRTDEERSAWLLLGRGHETGVVAQALQNDLAMAYHRLALLSAEPVAQDEREAFEVAMRDRYNCTNHSFVRAPDGYAHTVGHRSMRLAYASVQMLWETFQAGRASLSASPAVPVAQDEREAPSVDAAYYMGAKGGQANEAERLAFEAWMRGHCWALCAEWTGTQYLGSSEQGGDVDPRAMMTRRLWAAWRDRAALSAATPPAAPTCWAMACSNRLEQPPEWLERAQPADNKENGK